jgi:hypothetical protein
LKYISQVAINSENIMAIVLKESVNIKGSNLNKVGTANSVSNIISCVG